MRALVQRVSEAGVEVEGRGEVSKIGRGLLVLLCVMKGDTGRDVEYLARKVINLRVFEDSAGKMNLSLKETGGGALVVSQFTLAADTAKGNRPSFTEAAEPAHGESLYEEFMERLKAEGIAVGAGVFAANMAVRLINDGPVTIMLDSREQRK